MSICQLDHLQTLETEAIHVLREVAAVFKRPVIMFAGGRDSICLLRAAEKAFSPSPIPMPLLHIEAADEHPSIRIFCDRLAEKAGAKLIVRTVSDAIEKGIAVLPLETSDRKFLVIPTLLAAIEEFHFDALVGGTRRDADNARARERIFSFRNSFGQWDPRGERPEVWNIYNGTVNPGEHMRVFPLSNWTEADILEYIERENLKESGLN